MPRAKRNVQVAADSSKQLVKPTPPADLWAGMDKLHDELYDKPPNSFTLNEYMEKYGVTTDIAYKRLHKLVVKGKLEKIKKGVRSWYRIIS